MCLAIPGKIIKINGEIAIVDYGELQKEINISLVDVKVEDYVIANAGFAIKKIHENEALESIKLFSKLK